MIFYKLLPMNTEGIFKDTIQSVKKLRDDGVIEICLVTAQDFKAQINADEAQLEDADGVLMSPEEAKAFVATLP